MSDQSKKHTFALQDILSGIADGLNSAQENLNNAQPYDAFGRPNTIYQLPYLDFSLRVTTSSVSSPQHSKKMAFGRLPMQTCYFNINPLASPDSAEKEIISTISGRFVASPSNDNGPQRILELEEGKISKNDNAYDVNIKVICKDVMGEVYKGVKVEFNFDLEASNLLTDKVITKTPVLNSGIVETEEDGAADVVLTIPKDEFEASITFVITANAANLYQTIAIQKQD